MKTNKRQAKVMILSFLALCLGVVSCYDDTALLERIEALETTKIATINQQIAAITSSITDLEAMDKELDAAIAALVKENAECVDELKAKDNVLDNRIDELKAYVDAISSASKDWASATFSTLEQYQTTCNEIAAIKVLVAEQEANLTKALADAIAASETSIKGWVNEQLTGYWTIAETQAKLDTIKINTDKEVEAVKADLEAATEELTAAYKSEIAKAIESSEGKLSAKIAEINSTLDKRIGAIEARLDAIEAKLNNLTREFAIVFNDNEIGIMPGGATTVSYTITGATENTIVKAFGQNGWSAKVSMESNTTGSITVKAPDPITEEEIIVLAYDGEFRTIMSCINFVMGFATPSQAAIEFGENADTVTVELTSNVDCEVSIPANAQSWLSVVEPSATRAVTTKSISFACTECIGGIRKATVSFVDEAGVVVSTMSFVQQGSTIEVTLTEAGTLMETIGQDVVRDVKGLIINGPINGTDVLCIRKMANLVYLNMENARIVEGGDPYIEGGYYTKENVIGTSMFQDAQCFQEGNGEVILPANTVAVERSAFNYCEGLTSVQMPSTVQIINDDVFWCCTGLTHITLPEGLKIIGIDAFGACNLEEIIFPEELMTIRRGAFYRNNIKSLTIPSRVREIGEGAFTDNPITEVHLKVSPTILKTIGNNLFDADVYDNAVLYIPKGTLDDYSNTDFGFFKNIVEKYDYVDSREVEAIGDTVIINRSKVLLPNQGTGDMGKAYPVLEGAYVFNYGGRENVIVYDSKLYRSEKTLSGVRFVVLESGDTREETGGFARFCLSSFKMYDDKGCEIQLTEETIRSNACQVEVNSDYSYPNSMIGVRALIDDDEETYFHSTYKKIVPEHHYIEVALPKGEYNAFSFSMTAYSCNHSRVFPAVMQIIPIYDVDN